MTTKRLFSTGIIALAIMAISSDVWARSSTPESIMVVPARKRMVQLAFELSRFKEIGLVTYNTSPSLSAPLLHAWNGHEWVQISMDDYVAGRFMSGAPKHVFLLGDATTLPLQMMDGPTWYKGLNRITTLDIATIVNQMGNTLHFSARQWKWLAETYGMTIEDQSVERRRYGRWGAPGKEKDLKPTAIDNIVLPPPAPIVDPIVVQPKVAPAPAEAPKVMPEAVKVEPAKVEPVKVEPPKVEMPVPTKDAAPVVVEKPAVPVTVTVTPEPAKPEPPKVELPAVVTPATK